MLLQGDKKNLKNKRNLIFIIQDLVSDRQLKNGNYINNIMILLPVLSIVRMLLTIVIYFCKNIITLDYVSVAHWCVCYMTYFYMIGDFRQDGRKGLHAFTHPKTGLNQCY